MAIKLSDVLRSKIVDSGVLGYLHGSARLDVYNGTAPATAETATAGSSGTLLVSIGTAGISWVAASNGTAGINGTFSGTATASGTAAWARLIAGTHCIQGACGTESTSEFVIDTLIITSSNVVKTTSLDVIQSAG